MDNHRIGGPAFDHQGFAERYPHPGDDPIKRLRHTLDVWAGWPDDGWAVDATNNAYPDGGRTGLTWGDLRKLAARLGA